MSEERGAPAVTFAEGELAGLRPKPTIWRNIAMFYRKRTLGALGATVALLLIVVAVFAPFIKTHSEYKSNFERVYAEPSKDMLFGGDHLGRDVFSRIVVGSRISLRVGLISAFVGSAIGLLIGVSSAYFGGLTDLLVQRIIDAMISFPGLVLAIAIVAGLGASINNVIAALCILFIPSTARLIRSQTLAVKEMDYVLAARSVGAGDLRIMWRHIVPQVAAVLIVIITFQVGVAIIAEAALSFLGLGAGPEEPSWGGMLRGATQTVVGVGPWLALFPGVAIAVVVFSWNVLGDALRDVLDPRLRGSS